MGLLIWTSPQRGRVVSGIEGNDAQKGKKAKVASAKKPKAIEYFNKEECQKALLKLTEAQRIGIKKMKKQLSSISN
jgi:hypothetical protein